MRDKLSVRHALDWEATVIEWPHFVHKNTWVDNDITSSV
jgi:hypothetical protein